MACSYDVSFNDCAVTCTDQSGCPDGLSCVANMCRLDGNTGACAAAGSVTLSQTADDNIDRNLVFACTNTDSTTAESSWYRVFSLADAGVTDVFHVTSVSFGICFAVGDPHVTVRLSSYAGSIADTTLDTTKLTTIGSADQKVTSTQITAQITTMLAADVPAGSVLVAEIATSNLNGTGQQVSIGSTDAAETHVAYIRTPSCGQAQPKTTVSAGLNAANFVISVTGTH